MADDGFTKRKETRFLAGLNSKLHYRGQEYPCSAENLSRGGALLVGRMPWPEGERLEFTLLSPLGDLRLRAWGRIVRLDAGQSADEVQVGLEFENLNAGQQHTLDGLVSRVVEGSVPAPLAKLGNNASAGEIRAALQHVPLTHKITLATRAQAREREWLMQDSSSQVLDGIARNPNLTPPEMRVLLRRRELLPTTLQRVLNDSKWSKDEEARILVASHPRVTVAIAREAIDGMTEKSKQMLLRRPGVPPLVRTELAQANRSGRRSW